MQKMRKVITESKQLGNDPLLFRSLRNIRYYEKAIKKAKTHYP